jgi:phosphoenolpyruvate-protein phosphotransferase
MRAIQTFLRGRATHLQSSALRNRDNLMQQETPPQQPEAASGSSGGDATSADEVPSTKGIGVSAGVAVGPALVYRPRAQPSLNASAAASSDSAQEQARLRAALLEAAGELRALAEQVGKMVGPSEGGIFEAQSMMLGDPTIEERASALIEERRLDAASALQVASEEQARKLAGLEDPVWQARAADVRDACGRAIALLTPSELRQPTPAERLASAAEPPIVVADDLAPSDTVKMRQENVLAIALARGGATSHAAILARALGIPAVVGLGADLLDRVHDGQMLVVDGASGKTLLQPTTAQVVAARQAQERRLETARASRESATLWRGRPGRLRDGRSIPIMANVGTLEDAKAAAAVGAEGIGLLRTEFLFAQSAALPDEDEQANLYAAVIETLGVTAGSIIVRTLDAGADKPLASLAPFTGALPTEVNPALGVRGIRLQLAFRALLAAQFRSLLLAAARSQSERPVDLQIMLPMVTTVEEVREAKAIMAAERAALLERGVHIARELPIGIMVETPAAVFACEALATEAAFFSIGTNDLTQYVMATDRLNPRLADLCQPIQPAVLRAIATVVAAGHAAGRTVGVCGEMASDPRLALLLVGLGVDELSMNPATIPDVKVALAEHSLGEAQELAHQALQATTLVETQRVLAQLDHAQTQRP